MGHYIGEEAVIFIQFEKPGHSRNKDHHSYDRGRATLSGRARFA